MSDSGKDGQTYAEYIIIGAGPAGLQLTYYMEKAGRDYLVLEGGDTAGHFFKTFPRHRKLISTNKVYTGSDDPEFNMRMDWNSLLTDDNDLLMKDYSKRYFPAAEDIVRYFSDFAQKYGIKIRYRTKVVNVRKEGDLFKLTDADGNTYACRRLIIATGLSPYVPPIKGIELAEQYTEVSVDPEDFTNQRVLIIGKGNSAFETADNLVETTAVIHLTSPSPLKLAWKSHFVGHLRAVNNNVVETYLLKSQNALLDAHIEEIARREDGKFVVTYTYVRTPDSVRQVGIYDRVIACAGWRFDDSMLDESLKPASSINGRFPEQTSEWESTNIPGLFIAGALMQMRDYKKTMSAFIHGFRFNVQALFRILEEKYHGQEWPSRRLGASADEVVEVVVDRLNRSAALWQQPGYFGDLLTVSDDGTARYYENMPVDYIREGEYGRRPDFYLITLEYGPDYPDYPFEFVRHIAPDEAHLNPQLHPVIRHYRNSELVGEHHVMEDLEANWSADQFTTPLRLFFQEQLAQGQGQAQLV